MNSRVSSSVEGVDPRIWAQAEDAARRAGVSLADWLNATIARAGASGSPVSGEAQRNALPDREAKGVAEIHNRLDSISRQIEQFPTAAQPGASPAAGHLNEAISRLDVRLSQAGELAASARPQAASPPINPGSLESAIAELTARQNELDISVNRRSSRVGRNEAPAPDLSGLERLLVKITSEMESLQRPDIEQSITSFRGELADIRNVITEALPRRAIESLESEIRSLSRRIDETRQSGADDHALAGIERALNDVHNALRSLTPAEQLAGFDDAIRNLGGKLDLIVRASDDSGTVQQLESAIAALRGIVSNVASNEALDQLGEDVRMLAAKVDQFSIPDSFGDSFAALEQRIAVLTTTLAARPQGVIPDHSNHLEGALRALSDRLDHLPVGNDGGSAFTHLEQRVSYLLERLEAASEHRGDNFGRVEEGLQDILRHLERQSASFASLASAGVATAGSGIDATLADAVNRGLNEMRFSQTEIDRHTQDSLEVVHNTLGHVVDRLAMIEGDLRAACANPAPAAPALMTTPRPELSHPAATPSPHPSTSAVQNNAAAAMAAPRAIGDILDQHAAPQQRTAPAIEPHQMQSRPVLNPELPPDFPLEPGTLPQAVVTPSSPAAADGDAETAGAPASTSSFIAAARRAAQAAATAVPANDKTKARTAGAAAGSAAGEPSSITTKIRSLLVGASVVVIVLGSFKMAMNLLEGSSSAPAESSRQAPLILAPAESPSKPLSQAPGMPSIASPKSLDRQSMIAPAPVENSGPFATVPAAAPTPAQIANADVTGSIPQQSAGSTTLPAGRKPTQISIPADEKLPEAIGGPQLRAAALKGDPAAAYEVGVRYAEARGVVANMDEAAKWYDRAAQAGLVPAMFRIGTLYEKGVSVKKDTATARRYYTVAAERGNAKAMHNLAVLDADGGGAGANYKGAAHWFRKAADRGVADSQYNLGILYARGIGVEQNLAESFKWFSLAAAQGDADSATKRDDVAKRLDPQSLAAAKLAIQTFTPEPQPEEAVSVAAPSGGWDSAAAPAAKPAGTKRAAR